MNHAAFNEYDKKALEILDGFLPDHIFDAHVHISSEEAEDCHEPGIVTIADFLRDMTPFFGEKRSLHGNMILWPKTSFQENYEAVKPHTLQFLKDELDCHPGNVGEILVFPTDTPESLEKQLIHPNIRGFKCYHFYAGREKTWDAEIGEYLPEAAWEVAQKHKLAITLHMVKDHALSDPGNLTYIKTMSRRYPDATLILAHAARSFAAWTGIEAVAELAPYDNIYFDFSAVCESPALFQILKKIGTKRVMWGSDYAVSMMRGKAISLADTFYWIYNEDLENFASRGTALHSWLIGIENLMATREACMFADLKESAIEDLFYTNAMDLFFPDQK